jgi:hypothetical protein
MITLILAILASPLRIWAQPDPDADYTVREMAGELTASEQADEAAEERANHEWCTSAKDLIW